MNPDRLEVSKKWTLNYPELDRIELDEYMPETVLTQLRQKTSSLEMMDELPIRYFRSYKVVKALCNLSNFKFVFKTNEIFLDIFFKKFECEVLQNPQSLANIDHIIIFLQFLIRNEFQLLYPFLVKMNLPFKFYPNITSSKVFDTLLSLSFPGAPEFHFGKESWRRLLEYYQKSEYYLDMSKLLLRGGSIDPKKLGNKYSPFRIDEKEMFAILKTYQLSIQIDEDPTASNLEDAATLGSSFIYSGGFDYRRSNNLAEVDLKIAKDIDRIDHKYSSKRKTKHF